jgi:uncharacterized small protein (DUF1192 family)
MPSIEELQSAVTQSLEAAVDSMRFASELMAKNTAQQQEIERLKAEELAQRAGKCAEQKRRVFEVGKLQAEVERLRGENSELLQENVRLLTPTHDEFRQLLAAQRTRERPVDVEAIVQEIETETGLGPGACAAIQRHAPGILRRHFEPQGEPHERDEVPVRDSAVLEPGVSVEPGVSGASAATAPQRERVEVACGDGRSMESVQAVAAQAVAPASPLRAEETHCHCDPDCPSSEHSCPEHGDQAIIRSVRAELAALRKQVEEGERDTKRLDWLGTENNFCFVDIVGVDKGSGLFNSNRQATMRTLREAIDAATPEPKEPANG